MNPATAEDVVGDLRRAAEGVNSALRDRLSAYRDAPRTLLDAMRYSVEAGGKRLRPVLVLWCCELCGGRAERAMPAAVAVECVHTFSLIHDDLPALDNDDFRRGLPSCHRKFGEAAAILAGDALLALAFEVLTSAEDLPPALIVALVAELASATGPGGLIGGEVRDLEGERRPVDKALVERIHQAKTARLVQASCRMGGMIGDAKESELSALSAYGLALGMAFQAADDLLDLTGTTEALGKKSGKDECAGKQTFARAVGMDDARFIALERAEEARKVLEPFGAPAARLQRLAAFVVERNS